MVVMVDLVLAGFQWGNAWFIYLGDVIVVCSISSRDAFCILQCSSHLDGGDGRLSASWFPVGECLVYIPR